jgi:hypothetical protein
VIRWQAPDALATPSNTAPDSTLDESASHVCNFLLKELTDYHHETLAYGYASLVIYQSGFAC